MHCYVCVTYLMIIATAHPPKNREAPKTLEKRSIFNDVIQSLRIRSQLPDNINLNVENNIGQNYDKYGFDSEPLQLPSDIDFMPRRNDRIEMPSLKYRFPKNLKTNDTFTPKEEIVVYVNTPTEYDAITTSTQKPKKQKRPKPTTNTNKVGNKIKDENESEPDNGPSEMPIINSMAGQSHIGNRDSQTVVKPTVIVNFRGSVMHRESDIRIERRKTRNDTVIPHNVFNIKQEVKLERNDPRLDSNGNVKKVPVTVNQGVKIVDNEKARIEEDMMMCETASWKEKEKKDRKERKHDTLQILVSV